MKKIKQCSCVKDNSLRFKSKKSKADEPVAKEKKGPIEWAYHAQATWPGLCTEGKEQSPIDIKVADAQPPKNKLKFVYKESMQAENETGMNRLIEGCLGEIVLKQNGADNEMKQNGGGIWFHHPSEHSIDGKLADFELQIVHRAVGELPKEFVIVSLLQKQDPTATENDPIIKEITKGNGNNTNINLSDEKVHKSFKEKVFFQQDGSATAPGCDESVLWIVSDIVKINTSQYDMLKLLTKGYNGKDGKPHNRLIQEINERKVFKIEV